MIVDLVLWSYHNAPLRLLFLLYKLLIPHLHFLLLLSIKIRQRPYQDLVGFIEITVVVLVGFGSRVLLLVGVRF